MVSGMDKRKGLEEEPKPACIACRKRKRRCSRGHPCGNCEKSSIECVYSEEVGIKARSKQSIVQRLSELEEASRRQDEVLKRAFPDYYEQCIAFQSEESRENSTYDERSPKRVKVFENNHSDVSNRDSDSENINASNVLDLMVHRNVQEDYFLPPDDLMDSLIDIYFAMIHPWIPMLHQRTFEEKVRHPHARGSLINILHAIVTATIRFSDDPRLHSLETKTGIARLCRERVILRSMEAYSVENLQALIIIAFDLIGAGKGPKSWSIVDSMTQVVQHLQLSFEHGHDKSTEPQRLLHRVTFLKPPESWVEEEERRRTFWCVFSLDRFCSVSAGWAASILSDKIKRKLPCGGTFYFKERHVNTRHFSSELEQLNDSDTDREEVASLGGLAYCIEATESLSQVAQFYLDYEIDVNNANSLQTWLGHFRRLDERLARWKKEHLPKEWQQVIPRTVNHISGKPIYDENLTLAHVTHNASVILLHQHIAYPTFAQWQVQMRKSQTTASANASLSAATEIANMTEKFLSVNDCGITNPQYSFCLFVSGRAILAHSAFYQAPVRPEFYQMVKSLSQIAGRWRGSFQRGSNLASKFANALMHSLNQVENHLPVDIRKSFYNEEAKADLQSQPRLSVSSTGPSPEAANVEDVDIAQYPKFFQAVDFDSLLRAGSDDGNGGASIENSGGIGISSELPQEISLLFDDPEFMELDRVWDVSGNT